MWDVKVGTEWLDVKKEDTGDLIDQGETPFSFRRLLSKNQGHPS